MPAVRPSRCGRSNWNADAACRSDNSRAAARPFHPRPTPCQWRLEWPWYPLRRHRLWPQSRARSRALPQPPTTNSIASSRRRLPAYSCDALRTAPFGLLITSCCTNVAGQHSLPSRDGNGADPANWYSYFLASPKIFRLVTNDSFNGLPYRFSRPLAGIRCSLKRIDRAPPCNRRTSRIYR